MRETYGVPDSKVHGTNMGPIWGRQDPGGPHVGPVNFAIWGAFFNITPDVYFASAIVVPYTKSCYVGPCYNSTRLYYMLALVYFSIFLLNPSRTSLVYIWDQGPQFLADINLQ